MRAAAVRWGWVLAAMTVLAWPAPPARAQSAAPPPARPGRMSELEGHIGLGYARLFIAHPPGGSLAVSGGVDLPIAGPWRIGVDVGFDLLGSRTVERDSVFASLDYNAFEADLLVHWQGAGPARVSLGPGLMAARADVSVASGGGAAFSDLAVEKVVPEAAGEITLMPRRPMPVKLGVAAGVHVGFVPHDRWTIGDLKVTVRY